MSRVEAIDCVADFRPAVERFKALYHVLDAEHLAYEDFAAVYAENLQFVDSFHAIDGLDAYIAYCAEMYANLKMISFDFKDEFIKPSEAMLTWTMTYAHPRLNRGREISVEGASLLRFDEKIHYHRDYYDGGELLYEHVPLLGSVIQGLKKRMVK